MDKQYKRSEVIRSSDITESGEIDLSFSSETPVRDWWGGDPVVLLHERQAVDFSRINSMLLNHNPDRILGAVVETRIDDDNVARARVRFDSDEDSQRALAKVQSGSLRGVSVSYRASDSVVVERNQHWTSPGGRQFEGPLIVATRWAPVELSLTPTPADHAVGVGRMDEDNQSVAEEEPVEMAKESVVAETRSDDNGVEQLDASRIAQEAMQIERKRCTALRGLAEKAKIDNAILSRWIDGGTSLEAAREEAFEVVVSRTPTVEATRGEIEVGPDPLDKYLEECRRSLETRFGVATPEDVSHDYMHSFDMLRRLESLHGNRAALTLGHNAYFMGKRITFVHAQDDFANLLENVANKKLRNGYTEAIATFEPWTVAGTLTDFKVASRTNFGQAKDFLETPELMPIQEQTLGDAKETISLSTYANKFSVSRQAMISDDLGGFSRMVQLFGNAAKRTINKLVYDHLTGTVTMAEDSKALFATDHTSGSNLAGSAGAPNDTRLAEARKLMRLQKGLARSGASDATLNILPQYLIVPAAHEHTVKQLVQGEYVPATAAAARVGYFSSLDVITEAYLDSKSTTAWYMAASPSSIDTIEVARLQGQTAPVMSRVEGVDVLGIAWVAYFDVGIRALDHRGLFKNAGA